MKKVSLATLLRQEAALSLSKAKDRVDRLLTGREVVLEIPTLEKAQEILKMARELGAQGTIQKEAAAS